MLAYYIALLCIFFGICIGFYAFYKGGNLKKSKILEIVAVILLAFALGIFIQGYRNKEAKKQNLEVFPFK
jgi:hypothetical protein